ncbi:MAG: transposase [Planctomycetota bacterium]
MIRAFHCIFGTYGFWLPNEPRGSWSTYVASWELLRYGKATTVSTRRSLARKPFDPKLRKQMRGSLKYEPVRFTGKQAVVVARSFIETGYTIHAMVVMPEHVHLVIGYTDRPIRRVIDHLKTSATRGLRECGWFTDRTPWAAHGWNVFLNSDADVMRCVKYVEANPLREGKRPQRWSGVMSYQKRESASRATRLNQFSPK